MKSDLQLFLPYNHSGHLNERSVSLLIVMGCFWSRSNTKQLASSARKDDWYCSALKAFYDQEIDDRHYTVFLYCSG
jgi:hypothetical protein